MSDDRVRAALDRILKKAGKGAAQMLADGADTDIDQVVPTGIDVLDHHVLAIGGFPLGRIVELYATEGVGKTSLLFQMVAGVQREGGVPVIVETEQALESQRAAVFGCDLDQVILSQPDTLEEALECIEDSIVCMPRTKVGDPPNLVGWDSLAATPTKLEVNEGIDGKQAVAERARILSRGFRILAPLCVEHRTLLAVVNQVKTKLGVMFGPNTTTPGGAALKYHASVRLEMFGGKSVKDGIDHVGKQVTFMAAKNKTGGRPWAKAKGRLYYDSGWENMWSTINLAKDRKVVPKAAEVTEEVYLQALAGLGGWSRGFASGHGSGEAEKGADEELLGGGDD